MPSNPVIIEDCGELKKGDPGYEIGGGDGDGNKRKSSEGDGEGDKEKDAKNAKKEKKKLKKAAKKVCASHLSLSSPSALPPLSLTSPSPLPQSLSNLHWTILSLTHRLPCPLEAPSRRVCLNASSKYCNEAFGTFGAPQRLQGPPSCRHHCSTTNATRCDPIYRFFLERSCLSCPSRLSLTSASLTVFTPGQEGCQEKGQKGDKEKRQSEEGKRQ